MKFLKQFEIDNKTRSFVNVYKRGSDDMYIISYYIDGICMFSLIKGASKFITKELPELYGYHTTLKYNSDSVLAILWKKVNDFIKEHKRECERKPALSRDMTVKEFWTHLFGDYWDKFSDVVFTDKKISDYISINNSYTIDVFNILTKNNYKKVKTTLNKLDYIVINFDKIMNTIYLFDATKLSLDMTIKEILDALPLSKKYRSHFAEVRISSFIDHIEYTQKITFKNKLRKKDYKIIKQALKYFGFKNVTTEINKNNNYYVSIPKQESE